MDAHFQLTLVCPRSRIVGHMLSLCLNFWGTTRLFSKAATPLYILHKGIYKVQCEVDLFVWCDIKINIIYFSIFITKIVLENFYLTVPSINLESHLCYKLMFKFLYFILLFSMLILCLLVIILNKILTPGRSTSPTF